MNERKTQSPISNLILILAILVSSVLSMRPMGAVKADHTPDPASVNLAGSLESEASGGACGDWDPGCPGAAFTSQGNLVYLFNSASIPSGNYEYKVAMGGWSENYGSNFQQDGPNINLNLASAQVVRFYYDHKTHYIADNVRNTIYTVPGSFNEELGCAGDWQPECLRTFMSDVDGDGIFTFVTDAIPAGNYEFKIATNESWSNPNYGQGGGPDNIPFTVPGGGATVTFSFNTSNNNPGVAVEPLVVQPGHDNNIFWDGLRHDSRDTLYRTPGGAVPEGTPVIIRFRTFHNDVTSVQLRVFSVNAGGQSLVNMTLAATDVSCYEELDYTCDYWSATLANANADNLWYRFIVTDGSDTDYYDDNTAALDGGLGATTDEIEDHSWALMVYEPDFTAPSWANDAFIYQIFPDRFRNGRSNNDPHTGDVRYDDPVLALPWNTLPEGYCRNYADGDTNCPWRFDTTPPSNSPTKEQPRGRDYMGGDLRGVDQYLTYLKSLGVNTIYFNPIFDAGSNHSYDTQDYTKIDPYFGTQQDWANLVRHGNQLGIRIVLDGVFNHMSSDSPFFDRYHHYPTVGACESVTSEYRSWFNFTDVPAGTGTCVGSDGTANAANYEGWFGFDSIPVLNKTEEEVQAYFLDNPNSIARYWLQQGAGGWRMDVSGDPSFPEGYWENFRSVTKSTKSDALLISETWQKDSTLLRMLRGDRLDTTMNYRLRDAVIGLLAPGNFDSKGFADSGRIIEPSEFAARIASMREDYPDAAYYSLMNLLDSHDTERLLWTLTPGAETRAEKEFNTPNLTAGKQSLKIASLIQFTMPGAPTVYYGDEVGVTGDDDPDDRRTYPWADRGGSPDNTLFAHYQTLSSLRTQYPSLTDGDIRILLADDASDTVAYGRKTNAQAAVVVINRGSQSQAVSIPVAGYLPDGTVLTRAYGVGVSGPSSLTVTDGQLTGTIGAKSAWLLVTGTVDLQPTAAPSGLTVSNEGDAEVSLAWNSVAGATGYNVYRSPVTGGGYVKANDTPVTDTTFIDTGLRNAQKYFYVVTALDSAGNESAYSNEVNATPHLVIGWANLQWPPTMTHTISVTDRTDDAYGQVWIDGATNQPGATESLRAQLGFGSEGTNPATDSSWVWVEATFNVDAGNNDEFKASLLPETTGTFDYVYRYTTTNGQDWLYADLNGPIPQGDVPPNPGKLTVNASGDTTPPAGPTNLDVVSASPVGIALEWDAVAGDPTLYGYEVLRSASSGGPYDTLALVTGTSYTDTAVAENETYFYVVRAVDTSFNRSDNSNEVEATAELRTVTLVFNVTVPATTDATGRSVYIAGFLDRLDGNNPQWDPGGVVLTRVDATHWTITFTGKESTQLEYKYALGSWDYVEKDVACGEINNRMLTLSYGTTGTQTVEDTVPNWRNVAPCGN
ncbi:MAG TPA: alpha-amylase family glycosyl hydrolase [Anaerolineales bacterium]|nr:alpha-amylase family glycosyl hydrolase [Anaerolineales bacterium]